MPRLAHSKPKHLDVSLRIEESSRDNQDLIPEDIDLSARLGNGKWPGIHAWHLATEDVRPVCSPDYLKSFSPLRKPADLLRHTLLNFEERHRTRIGWREWLERHSVPVSRLKQDFVFTDALGSIEAAVLGQGIALGWRHLVQDHIRGGRLVFPMAETHCSGEAVYIVMPAQRLPKRGAELFRDWLVEQDCDASDLVAGRR